MKSSRAWRRRCGGARPERLQETGPPRRPAELHGPRDVPRMHDWIHRLYFQTVYHLFWTGYHLGWSFRSEGNHHVPRRGPLLIIANHESFLDPIAVGLAVRRRRTAFLARKTL